MILIWEASDRICGKRLKAALSHLVSPRNDTAIWTWTRR